MARDAAPCAAQQVSPTKSLQLRFEIETGLNTEKNTLLPTEQCQKTSQKTAGLMDPKVIRI